jgi:hypothetical protein
MMMMMECGAVKNRHTGSASAHMCVIVQAWDVRNSCKHNGAVLPLPSAPEGRGADGVDAMA